MIHASEMIAMDRCARSAVLQREQPVEIPMAAAIESYSSLWIRACHLEDLESGKPYDTTEDTKRILAKGKGGLFLRLEYRGIRTKIAALLPVEGGYHAIYPALALMPKDNLLPGMMLDSYIAGQLGIDIVSHEVIYMDKNYVRGEILEPEKLLIRSDHVRKNRGGFYEETIDEILEEDMPEVDFEGWIDEAHDLFDGGELPDPRRNRNCVGKRKCVYFEDCFQEDSLPASSIRHLSSSQNKQQMEAQGRKTLAMADPAKIEGLPMQYAQIQAARLGGLFMDVPALQHWFSTIQYPLTYMDFEWDTYSIPPHPGMKPFEVLCFQYSLHIQRTEDTDPEQLEHLNFFETGDCRRDFIEGLLRDLPAEGSILVFNLEGGEKLRLLQLARQFPEYETQINGIIDRLVDLAAPFESGHYYQLEQKGRFSLKTLLPLFSAENGYSGLDVHDGLQAVQAYRACLKETDPEKAEQIANAISEYCAMDTLAEARLFHALKHKVEQKAAGH